MAQFDPQSAKAVSKYVWKQLRQPVKRPYYPQVRASAGSLMIAGRAGVESGTYPSLASWSTATSNKWTFQLGSAVYSSVLAFTPDAPVEYVDVWNEGSGYIANGTIASLYLRDGDYYCNVQGTRKVSGPLAAPLGSGGTGVVNGVQVSDSDFNIPTGWRLPTGTRVSAWWDGFYFTVMSYQGCPEVE